jgi:hypothetical protein
MATPQLIAKSSRMEICKEGKKEYSLYLDGEYICSLEKWEDSFSIRDDLGEKMLEKFLIVKTEDFIDGLDLYFDYDTELLSGHTALFFIKRKSLGIEVVLSIKGDREYPETDTAFIDLLRKMGRNRKKFDLEVQDFEDNLEMGFAIFIWKTEVGEYIGTLRDTLLDKIKALMIASGAAAD